MRPPIHIHFWQGRERTEGHRWACYRPYRIDLIGRGAPQRIAEYPAHDRAAAVARAVRFARAENLPIILYNADITETEAEGVRIIHPPPFRSRTLTRPRPASGIDAPAACPCAVEDRQTIYCRAAHRRRCPAARAGGPCLLQHPAGPWRAVAAEMGAGTEPITAWALLDAAGGA